LESRGHPGAPTLQVFGDHAEDDLPEVLRRRRVEEVGRPPDRRGVEGRGGDDGVGERGLPPVEVEHLGRRHVRADLPGGVAGLEVDRLARGDGAEPEPLHVQSEMLHEPQTGPTGRQHGPS
jgi:hypothetical protein